MASSKPTPHSLVSLKTDLALAKLVSNVHPLTDPLIHCAPVSGEASGHYTSDAGEVGQGQVRAYHSHIYRLAF
jgi:hypothetical protein